MKKVFIAMLAIVIVILSFSLGSWGVESEAVLAGYENTRKYATDAKMLTVAVDTYKNAVNLRIEDEEARNNFEPSATIDLGAFNAMLTEEEYEAYTQSFILSSDPEVYPTGNSGYNADRRLPPSDKVLSANYDGDVINYLTTDNKPCSDSTELDMYCAIQCAAFADAYVNQMSYKEYALDKKTWVIVGSGLKDKQRADDEVFSTMGTAWRSNSTGSVSFENDAKGMYEFFSGVTPGTFVRTNSDNLHSYIILGGDDNGLLIYDANTDLKCGIRLRYLTWSSLVKPGYKNDSCYATDICLVIAPPNTKLPAGCTSNTYGSHGHIIGKESE